MTEEICEGGLPYHKLRLSRRKCYILRLIRFFIFFLHTKFRKIISMLLLKTQKIPLSKKILESFCLIVVKDAVKF